MCVLSGRPRFNPRSSHTKTKQTLVLDTSLNSLNIIRYGSRISGAIQGKEYHPPLHLGVVAIEKGAFGLPSTTVSQLTNFNVESILIHKIFTVLYAQKSREQSQYISNIK